MTDKQKIARLVAALRPFAEMRKAAKGRMSMVGIGSLKRDAEVYSVNPDGRFYRVTAGDFDRAVAAIEAAERKEAGNG